MNKNKRQYTQQVLKNAKILNESLNRITPEIYAAIALALNRTYGFGYERINKVFAESQNIWDECVMSNTNMVEMCYNEIGIELRSK